VPLLLHMVPEAVQVRFAQHRSPLPPQGRQRPPLQTAPVPEQVSPAQHASPSAPQVGASRGPPSGVDVRVVVDVVVDVGVLVEVVVDVLVEVVVDVGVLVEVVVLVWVVVAVGVASVAGASGIAASPAGASRPPASPAGASRPPASPAGASRPPASLAGASGTPASEAGASRTTASGGPESFFGFTPELSLAQPASRSSKAQEPIAVRGISTSVRIFLMSPSVGVRAPEEYPSRQRSDGNRHFFRQPSSAASNDRASPPTAEDHNDTP
jgi:hypothetical protein